MKFRIFTLVFLIMLAACGKPADNTNATVSGKGSENQGGNNGGENGGGSGDTGGSTTSQAPEGTVDLGLSVYWGIQNVGATAQEQAGEFYGWGEVAPHKKDSGEYGMYDWPVYKWCNWYSGSLPSSYTKYWSDENDSSADGLLKLAPEDDAAHVNLGGNWRMPTKAEYQELRDTKNDSANYKWEWKTIGEMPGMEITYVKNGSKIFFPAAGYHYVNSYLAAGSRGDYWTSEKEDDNNHRATLFRFMPSQHYAVAEQRCYGLPIRAVLPKD